MRPKIPARTLALTGAALALCLFAAPAAAQASSAHYVLQQSTVNGGGAASVSPTGTAHRSSDSLGQESVIGCSSSFHFVLQSGFWSYAGQGLVPVVLTVKKNVTTPSLPDLSWTGNNPYYFIYRSTSASTIFSNLLMTSPLQSWTDGAPPAAPVVFYTILATAPGPVPPQEQVVTEPAAP